MRGADAAGRRHVGGRAEMRTHANRHHNCIHAQACGSPSCIWYYVCHWLLRNAVDGTATPEAATHATGTWPCTAAAASGGKRRPIRPGPSATAPARYAHFRWMPNSASAGARGQGHPMHPTISTAQQASPSALNHHAWPLLGLLRVAVGAAVTMASLTAAARPQVRVAAAAAAGLRQAARRPRRPSQPADGGRPGLFSAPARPASPRCTRERGAKASAGDRRCPPNALAQRSGST